MYGPSPEDVMTRSDSLSLSSYSSWLLVPSASEARVVMCSVEGAPGLTTLLRLRLGVCCTRKPVVTTSSLAEDKEEEDGWELISTHESAERLPMPLI